MQGPSFSDFPINDTRTRKTSKGTSKSHSNGYRRTWTALKRWIIDRAIEIKHFKSAAIVYLFCGEGSRPLSRTFPASGGCMLTVLFGEESSGPENCAGFFYEKDNSRI